MKLTHDQISKLAQPDVMDMMTQVLENPRRVLDTLDILIRSPHTSPESRQRFRGVRQSVENLCLDQPGSGIISKENA